MPIVMVSVGELFRHYPFRAIRYMGVHRSRKAADQEAARLEKRGNETAVVYGPVARVELPLGAKRFYVVAVKRKYRRAI